jgi:hypothetical protein
MLHACAARFDVTENLENLCAARFDVTDNLENLNFLDFGLKQGPKQAVQLQQKH